MVRLPCAAILVCLLAPIADAAPLHALAVQDGRCECVLTTDRADDQFLLVLGSLARSGGPFRVTVSTAPTVAAESVPPETPAADPLWPINVRDLAERQAKARAQNPPASSYAPLAEPPRQKTFYLFVKDGDFQSAANYVAVPAELRGVGKRCQVYVDQAHPDPRGLQPTIDDVIRTFDEEVLPRALGTALDVDRDGRFTILFSGWLAKLQSGQVKLGGFVRGSDFYLDLAAPYGNRCDMMYLNTDLRPGPYLRTLLAHEYTHGVLFSEHVFGDYLPVVTRQDEESWLNEAICHTVEDRHGYSWANLDYRISAFLNDPPRYSLIVPDYYGRKLWRDPGTRGCAYLFLRWCLDRFGPELLTRLVRSNLCGVDNLEVATQCRLAELFRQWSVAVGMSGTGIDADGVAPLRRLSLHGPLGDRLLCGPRQDVMTLTNGRNELTLAATGVGYVLLHSPGGPRSQVVVATDPQAALQVSLVRLPAGLPRLELRGERDAKGMVRLAVTACNAAVRLEAAAWERPVTREEARGDSSHEPGKSSEDSVRGWFGGMQLNTGETRRSEPLPVPSQDVVFKVVGVDAAGRRVSAWSRCGP
jgi:hypothetical protein